MSATVINTRLPVSVSPERLAEIEGELRDAFRESPIVPISYTEFCKRLASANAEAANGKVLLDKRTNGPEPAEYAKQRAILEKHGVVGFELRWDRSARRFFMEMTK